MKRTFLSLFVIAVMAAFGSVMAQTGTNAPDQPAAAMPSSTASGTPVVQQDSPGTQPGTPAGDTVSQPATEKPATDQPATDTGTPAASGTAGRATRTGKLPATASNNPLLALLGVVSLAAFTILLVVRRRGDVRS
jgi:LPXTG-motif cell wall-anchored protein